MAILFDAEVVPDALTAFVRELPVPEELAFFNAMPQEFHDDHKIRFSELVQTNRVASFRTWDGNFPTLGRDSASHSEVSLIPLGASSTQGEYERLLLELARNEGGNKARLAEAIYNDAEQLTNSIYRRLELAWGQVYTTGGLAIRENGIAGNAGVVDFGLPETHTGNVAAKSWSDPTALVLDELLAWAETYENEGVGAPGAIRVKLKTFRQLTRNAQIVDLAKGEGSTRTRVTLNEVVEVLSDEGLPPIQFLPDVALRTQDGQDTKVVPDNLLLMTPADLGSLGQTALGISVTALELLDSRKVELTITGAAGLVGVVEKVGPPYRKSTYVDATALPVLTEPRRLFIATV